MALFQEHFIYKNRTKILFIKTDGRRNLPSPDLDNYILLLSRKSYLLETVSKYSVFFLTFFSSHISMISLYLTTFCKYSFTHTHTHTPVPAYTLFVSFTAHITSSNIWYTVVLPLLMVSLSMVSVTCSQYILPRRRVSAVQ